MKILILIGVLFSFSSFAEITYNCSKETWNQERFQGKMFHVEVQLVCQTSIDAADMDRVEAAMARRYQDASDVAQVHEVGESKVDGMIGTYVISNLKQSIPNRGNMNIKYHSFVGVDANEKIQTKSKSLNIVADGYSRYTKEIVLRRIISVVNGKVQFIFREFDKIEKPGIAPRGLFTRTAKKELANNTKRKVPWLMKYLDQNL